MNNKRLMIHSGLVATLAVFLVSSGVLASDAFPSAPPSLIANNPLTASLPDPVGPQAVLWSQTDTTGGESVNASNYTTVTDHLIADDFVINDIVNNYWMVTAVQVVGRYSPPSATQATSVNLLFYTDTITTTKHVPGTPVYNSVVNTTLVTGTATINLPSPALLPTGAPITYWVSIQPNIIANTTDAWLWTERNSASPFSGTSPSVYRGEGQGITSDCITKWGRRITDCQFPFGSTNVDMRFAILGKAVLFTDFVYLPVIRK